MQFWASFWTVVWFGGLSTFTALSFMVTIFGARDLVALLSSLKAQHEASQPEPE